MRLAARIHENPLQFYVSFALGVVLCCGAALKGHALYLMPCQENTLLGSPALTLGVVILEGLAGMLFFAGIQRRRMLALGLLLFSASAGFALSTALAGDQACHCFGVVSVNPWWALVLDSAAVVSLFCCLRPRGPERAGQRLSACAIILALCAGRTMGFLQQGREGQRGEGNVDGALDLKSWVKKPFPLEDTNLPPQTRTGAWTVLVVRPECPHCQELLAAYAAARRAGLAWPAAQVAVLELGRFGGPNGQGDIPGALYGHFLADRRFLARTPVRLMLQEGVVLQAAELN